MSDFTKQDLWAGLAMVVLLNRRLDEQYKHDTPPRLSDYDEVAGRAERMVAAMNKVFISNIEN